MLRDVRSKIQDKRFILNALLCSNLCIFIPIVLATGLLEVLSLSGSVGLYRTAYDPNCYVFVYPYDADEKEYVFGFRSREALGDGAAERGWLNLTMSNGAKSIQDASFGSGHQLAARECTHRFVPLSPGSPELKVLLLTGDKDSAETRVLPKFPACRRDHLIDPRVGPTLLWAGEHLERGPPVAISLILVWSCVRILGSVRDVRCRTYDEKYPPFPSDPESKRCFPFNRVFRPGYFVTITLKNYILFRLVPGFLLAPWTSISMHDTCPQLISQVVNPVLSFLALTLGTAIVAVAAFNELFWFVYRWDQQWSVLETSCHLVYIDNVKRLKPGREAIYFEKPELGECDDDDEEEEDEETWRRFSGLRRCVGIFCSTCNKAAMLRPYVVDVLFCGLAVAGVVLAIVALAVLWPWGISIPAELTFQWPQFAVSRQAHILQATVFISFLVDTLILFARVLADYSDDCALDSKTDALLTKDRSFVMKAISQEGQALEFAHEDLRRDVGVVLKAVDQSASALEFAHEDLRRDANFVPRVAALNWRALEFAHDDLLQDKDFMLRAVEQEGRALEFAHDDLRRDRDVVLRAVSENWRALEFAHDDLLDDREIVDAAVAQEDFALEFSHEQLRKDRDVVLQAVARNGLNLEFADEDLRNDKEVVLKAVLENSGALCFAHSDLLEDSEFVQRCKVLSSRLARQGSTNSLMARQGSTISLLLTRPGSAGSFASREEGHRSPLRLADENFDIPEQPFILPISPIAAGMPGPGSDSPEQQAAPEPAPLAQSPISKLDLPMLPDMVEEGTPLPRRAWEPNAHGQSGHLE